MQALQKIDLKFNNNQKLITILIAVFILKGIFYAAYVMPLTIAVSPDDVGHFSYIQYIAAERRLPIHGYSEMEVSTLNAHLAYRYAGEVVDFIIGEENFDSGRHNWISQHPPLYYILMAIVYSIASLFTRQFSTMILILRLANLAFGVASLVYIHKILNELNAKDVVRKCILIFFVFSAPLQFFFSAISNDSMLIFVCIFALYYLIKYMNTNRLKHFVIFVIGSALIFATKYNGFMVMLTYVAFFLYYSLRHNEIKETIKLSLIGVPIGLCIILPDLLFNYFAIGRVFANDGGVISHIGTDIRHDYPFYHFLFRTNYITYVTRHIIFLIGAWDVAVSAGFFEERIFGMLFLLLSMIHFFKCKNRIHACLILLAGTVGFVFIRYIIAIAGLTTGVGIIVTCMFFILCFSVLKSGCLEGKQREIQWLFIATLVIMVAVYVNTHYGIFRQHRVLRALHGRYYYIAFFPFAYLVFNQLGEVKSKAIRFAPAALMLVLVFVELHAITRTVGVW